MLASEPARRSARAIILCVVAITAGLGLAACGGSSTSPTSPSDILTFEVTCPSTLLIGQKGPCLAQARLRSGQMPVVSFDATWSSTRPDVVAVDALGLVTGRSGGEAVVSASYRGQSATATLAVIVEDALRIASGQAHQGDFRPGSTVTMMLQGYYSVATADTGLLSLRISDQTGTITTMLPMTVARGGDFFLLSATFVVPQQSIEVCRTAILVVGSVTIAEPQSNANGLRCIPIQR